MHSSDVKQVIVLEVVDRWKDGQTDEPHGNRHHKIWPRLNNSCQSAILDFSYVTFASCHLV